MSMTDHQSLPDSRMKIPLKWTSMSSTTSARIAQMQFRIHHAGKTRWGPRSLWRKRSSRVRNWPSSAPAQHAGGIAAVIDRRYDRWRRVGILGGAAKSRRRAAGFCERPGRIIGLLDRDLAVERGDDSGIAGLRQHDALQAHRADLRGAVLQHHGSLEPQRQDIECGAAHADDREPGGNLVGVLVGVPGHETEGAGGEPDRDVAVAVLVIEDRAVERDRR